jgi:hypothetical protein
VYGDRYQRTADGWKVPERIYEVRDLDTPPPAGSAPHAALANPATKNKSDEWKTVTSAPPLSPAPGISIRCTRASASPGRSGGRVPQLGFDEPRGREAVDEDGAIQPRAPRASTLAPVTATGVCVGCEQKAVLESAIAGNRPGPPRFNSR